VDFDAVVVGAGTAGATAALNLALFCRVLVLDRQRRPVWRIGESLSGVVRRLLSDMGLWEESIADGPLPRQALCSAWGSDEPMVRDALADLDGPGWQIDRVRFEQRLRAAAVRRGALLLSPAAVTGLARTADGWTVRFQAEAEPSAVTTRIVIDAAGRRSQVLVPHGARRRVDDRLSCAFIRAEAVSLPAGVIHIEAEAEGWWYAAPVPGGAGILSFHTDADLSAATMVRTMEGLLARARALLMLGELVAQRSWERGQWGYCAAHGAWLTPAAGNAWLAAGDAALAFDPLAAQGLFNAMYLGLAAGEATHRHLAGDQSALADYGTQVSAIRQAYCTRHAAWYQLETRWRDQPFWKRRHRPSGTTPDATRGPSACDREGPRMPPASEVRKIGQAETAAFSTSVGSPG
jgi:flavin-dependent dehydrogenase